MLLRWKVPAACLFLGALLAAPARAHAGTDQGGPSVSDLLKETQRSSSAQGKLSLVWWLPEEFWTLSWQKSADMTQERQDAFLKAVRPYLLIAVAEGKLGAIGGAEFLDKDALQASLKVIDSAGKTYAPLPDDQISGDVKNLSALLKSMFGNILGVMGQGLHLFCFPATSAAGIPLADGTKEGEFTVAIGEQSFKWRLPLSTLIPQKVCPVDGEKMSGAWKYCPFHGKPLKEAEKPAPADKPEPKDTRSGHDPT
jgi:hypothetical protein